MAYRLLAGFLVLVLLCSCSENQPVPYDKSSYVGYWNNKQMTLLIQRNGFVSCERFDHKKGKSISGPITRFDNTGFIVGVSFLSARFRVDEPPKKVNGTWIMVVDGMKLKRIDG